MKFVATKITMETKTQSQILGETYESVRNLTKLYFSKFDGIDLNKQLELNGVKFNSPQWLAAHLVWTEHFLIIKGLGNKSLDIPWLEEYSFGSNPDEIKTKLSYDEIMKKMDEVHTEAMSIISSLTDEQMEEPNHIGVTFGDSNTKRKILIHAIRHEPMHAGQLSWILKANGIKVV